MNNNNVRVMVTGAMMAAVFGVLGIINVLTGTALDMMLAYVMVIAIAYYGYYYGWKMSFIVVLASLVVLSLVGNLFFAFYSSLSMLLGVFYSYCCNNNCSNRFTTIGLIIVSAFKNIVGFGMLGGLVGMDLNQEMYEIYSFIINCVPFLKGIMFQELGYLLIWIALFVCEGYIVKVYSNLVIHKVMKRKLK